MSRCRWTACEGQQFRRPVSRITWQPYPEASPRTNELVKQMSEQAREGGGGGGVWVGMGGCTRLPWLELDLPAHISHHSPSSSFFRRSAVPSQSFHLPPLLPISVVHPGSCNPFVSLEDSPILNWIWSLSSPCSDAVLSSCTRRQWTAK